MSNTKKQIRRPTEVPKNLLTLSVCALIVILLSAAWFFYCVHISNWELDDRGAGYGLFAMVLFLAASGVISVGWLLVAIVASVAIIMCIIDHKKYNFALQRSVIIKHIVLTIVSLIPYIIEHVF